MKKIFVLVFAVMMMGLNNLSAQTPAKTTHVTKSGAPDKRYKENKTTAPVAKKGPLKKDGTPDMRYKVNKNQPQPAPEKKTTRAAAEVH